MKKAMVVISILLLLGFFFAHSQVEEVEDEPITVQASAHETLGSYLVDTAGMSLYLFLNDTENTSNCYDQCAENWPPLLVPEVLIETESEPRAGEGIDEELLGTTERDDDTVQVTYKGWPLYYFARDENPGDVNGQGVGEVWYLISPEGTPIMEEGGEQQEDEPQESAGGDDTPGSEEVPVGEEGVEEEASISSIWSGVFTEEQVERGEDAYRTACQSCHGSDLRSVEEEVRDLTDASFTFQWHGKTVAERFERIRTTMPPGREGSLDDQTYIDIVAFILHFNGYPAGDQELEPDMAVLEQIVIEPEP